MARLCLTLAAATSSHEWNVLLRMREPTVPTTAVKTMEFCRAGVCLLLCALLALAATSTVAAKKQKKLEIITEVNACCLHDHRSRW